MPRVDYFRPAAARSMVAVATIIALSHDMALADGLSIDKVYDPYVTPLEREVELRYFYLQDDDDPSRDGQQLYKAAIGMSLNDDVFVELYANGLKESSGSSMSIESYEIEIKWQLTEQGEYFADWGILFETEKERSADIWEQSATALIEKALGRWSATLNLEAVYEWGSDIDNEWESTLAGRLRYRYSPYFEPAVEIYSGDTAKGIGPTALGRIPLRGRSKIYWEAGLIFGIDSDSPDQVLRAMLEYEF